MKDNRPINLQLTTMRFPLTALISISHRLSGIVLFLALPFALWMLQQALGSPAGFGRLNHNLQSCWFLRAVCWIALSALTVHLLAGLRHILMDMGLADSLAAARRGSQVIALVSIVLIVLLGVYLW